MTKKLVYAAPGLLEGGATTEGILTTRALLFYEGKHTSMGGTSKSWTKAALEKIVTSTNKWLSEGRRIKLYASDADHAKISQGATIGYLSGQVELKEITESDLPMPGLTALVGKFGVFASVAIAGEENVTAYKDGRLKELSIGIGGDNVILEVSAVSIPALAGAALFGHATRETEFKFALTLGDAIADQNVERQMRSVSDLWWSFTDVMVSILEASPEDIAQSGKTADQLRSQAVDDFVAALRSRLSVPSPASVPPPVPLFSKSIDPVDESDIMPEEENPTIPVEQFTALQRSNELMQRQLALFTREKTLTSQFAALRVRAEALRDSAKMTPAQFKAQFESAPTVEVFSMTGAPSNEVLEKFSTDLDVFATKIIKAEAAVESLELYGQPVIDRFGSSLSDEPLPGEGDRAAKDQALDAEAQRLARMAVSSNRMVM
jgi:hypothetical protein